jgi:hypothetical protein
MIALKGVASVKKQLRTDASAEVSTPLIATPRCA